MLELDAHDAHPGVAAGYEACSTKLAFVAQLEHGATAVQAEQAGAATSTGLNEVVVAAHDEHAEGAATRNAVCATGRCSGAKAVSCRVATGANPAVQAVGAKPAVTTVGCVAGTKPADHAVGANPAVTIVGVVAGTNVGATATLVMGTVVTGIATPHRRSRQRSNNPMRVATTTGAGAATTGANATVGAGAATTGENATVGVGHVAHCASARGADALPSMM